MTPRSDKESLALIKAWQKWRGGSHGRELEEQACVDGDMNNILEFARFSFIAGWDQLKELLCAIAPHAIHHGDCDLKSWNRRMTKCRCGLFQQLTKLHELGLASDLVLKEARRLGA